jgi:hypothetical protein
MQDDVTHTEIADRLTRLEDKVDKKFDELKDILDAVTAVKTGGKVINWLAKMLAAGIAVGVILKGGAMWFVALGTK